MLEPRWAFSLVYSPTQDTLYALAGERGVGEAPSATVECLNLASLDNGW